MKRGEEKELKEEVKSERNEETGRSKKVGFVVKKEDFVFFSVGSRKASKI